MDDQEQNLIDTYFLKKKIERWFCLVLFIIFFSISLLFIMLLVLYVIVSYGLEELCKYIIYFLSFVCIVIMSINFDRWR